MERYKKQPRVGGKALIEEVDWDGNLMTSVVTIKSFMPLQDPTVFSAWVVYPVDPDYPVHRYLKVSDLINEKDDDKD